MPIGKGHFLSSFAACKLMMFAFVQIKLWSGDDCHQLSSSNVHRGSVDCFAVTSAATSNKVCAFLQLILLCALLLIFPTSCRAWLHLNCLVFIAACVIVCSYFVAPCTDQA